MLGYAPLMAGYTAVERATALELCAAGVTVFDVARWLGLSQATVYRWLRLEKGGQRAVAARSHDREAASSSETAQRAGENRRT